MKKKLFSIRSFHEWNKYPAKKWILHTVSLDSIAIDQEYCPKYCHCQGMVGLNWCFPTQWVDNFGNPWNYFKGCSNSCVPNIFRSKNSVLFTCIYYCFSNVHRHYLINKKFHFKPSGILPIIIMLHFCFSAHLKSTTIIICEICVFSFFCSPKEEA